MTWVRLSGVKTPSLIILLYNCIVCSFVAIGHFCNHSRVKFSPEKPCLWKLFDRFQVCSREELILSMLPGANTGRIDSPKGYIWPYIPRQVLIRTVYHLNNKYAHDSLNNIIGIYSVYSLGSVLWNIPLARR